jgi:arsenical pump membrane protein
MRHTSGHRLTSRGASRLEQCYIAVVIWIVVALATLGVIVRPWKTPEWIWAVAGAIILVVSHEISVGVALAGVRSGLDVYLFLIGMMLLAEVARIEGLFDYLAARAGRLARGSAHRLFWLIYLVGTVVTIVLSNDATAVVLTPAVAVVTKAMRVKNPLPYLYICAFVANAASFVLPISNPANLVIFGDRMPPLLDWIARFALPSLLSIAATFVVLRFTQRRALAQETLAETEEVYLATGGRIAALGIVATAIALLVASALAAPLGVATCIAGSATAIVVARAKIVSVLRGISWGVLVLVASLFVLVRALEQTGLVASLARHLDHPRLAGLVTGLACNVTNNLPAGLVAGRALAHAPQATTAVLIGIDLGPNISITGSLATLLWLAALRREGYAVTAWTFLKVGIVVTLPALLLALAVTRS